MAPSHLNPIQQQISISVVIPTIGRPSLLRAVDSVQSQTYQPLEIIVVCEKAIKDNKHVLEAKKLPLVKVLFNLSGKTSENRNQGLLEAHGDFVAFLDDDDLWEPEKLKIQAGVISDTDSTVICGKARYQGWKNVIVPSKILDYKKLFILSLYDTWSFRSRQYAIPTPTLLVPTKLAQKVLFDEGLSEREDIWFIHNLQIAGAKIYQVNQVLATIQSTKPYSKRKVLINQEVSWFLRLNTIKQNLGWKFLITISVRNCLLNLKFLAAARILIRAIKKYNYDLK
jgi:glycosyltransferase involved in cell wall biosynthesis